MASVYDLDDVVTELRALVVAVQALEAAIRQAATTVADAAAKPKR
jgi:hypothetical protein